MRLILRLGLVLRVGLVLRLGLILRVGLILGVMLRVGLPRMLRRAPPGLRRVPVPRLLGPLLLGWRRPTRRAPAGRGAVIGLPGTAGNVLRVMAAGGV